VLLWTAHRKIGGAAAHKGVLKAEGVKETSPTLEEVSRCRRGIEHRQIARDIVRPKRALRPRWARRSK